MSVKHESDTPGAPEQASGTQRELTEQDRVTAEGEAFESGPRRLRYLDCEPPGPGASVAVSQHVTWLRVPLPIELGHINLWLLDDGEGWTLVDTGLSASVCREEWERQEARTLGSKPLNRILLTHFHPDHMGLAHWLQERHGVPVWMSRRGLATARELLESDSSALADRSIAFLRRHGVTESDGVERLLGGAGFRRAVSGLPEVQHHPADGDAVVTGSAVWRSLECHGHADGHLCLHDAAARVLISGDQVLPTISPNVSLTAGDQGRDPLGAYLASLDRLHELPADTLVLPSHGRPFLGLHQRIDDLRNHHEEQLAALVRQCTEPRSARDVLPTLFGRRLIGFHFLLAMWEAIAHLEHLVATGRAERLEASSDATRYRSRNLPADPQATI